MGSSGERTGRALVTGSARGIGAAIAARLSADGFDVVVSNAAVTTTIAPAHRMSPEQWQRDVDVNLSGAFRVVQACLRGMRERRYGRIVAISSGAATGGLSGQVAYAASKAGLLGLVKTLALEGAGRGITLNAVLPGLIATEQVEAMPAEIRARVRAAMPTGRLGEPEEVAHLVSFLASEGAGYVTGQAIAIAGGADLNLISLGSAHRD